MSKVNKFFSYGRIVFYISFFIIMYLIPIDYNQHNSTCLFYQRFHLLCPTCGVTRAFRLILNLKFKQAYYYNALFTCCFAPICLFVIFQDIYIIIYRTIKKNNKYSLLESLWRN